MFDLTVPCLKFPRVKRNVSETDAKAYIKGYTIGDVQIGGCFLSRDVNGNVVFHHRGSVYSPETFVRKLEKDEKQARSRMKVARQQREVVQSAPIIYRPLFLPLPLPFMYQPIVYFV
jgi:hypothetical protein